MLHLMSMSPPMDLSSGRLILTLKILPSNQHCKTPQQVLNENNTVTEAKCVVGEKE